MYFSLCEILFLDIIIFSERHYFNCFQLNIKSEEKMYFKDVYVEYLECLVTTTVLYFVFDVSK